MSVASGLYVTAFRVHCNACGTVIEFVGPHCQADVMQWFVAHWLPVLDEADLTEPDGTLTTWRRP